MRSEACDSQPWSDSGIAFEGAIAVHLGRCKVSFSFLLQSLIIISNYPPFVKKQKEIGVDAIITDKVTRISDLHAVPSSEVLDRTMVEATFGALGPCGGAEILVTTATTTN